MGSTEALAHSIHDRYDELAERLNAVRGRLCPPGTHDGAREGPHRGCAPIDEFLTDASRHLHAVNALVVPRVKRVPGGRQAVRAYLMAAKALEVALAHAKAHEYGSTYEQHVPWAAVWDEVEKALDATRHAEERMVRRLADHSVDVEALGDRLAEAEPTEPTRPHPYLPHTGLLGAISRTVAVRTDAFWDNAEGRMIPTPEPEPKKRPGLIGQYLLGNPRFDDEP